ncbi:MAG: hypothetical protein PHE47_03315 [Oscillospiraceae bacterium]|nr:hypothetical protein [Oscillospiraceae bacterium]
MERKRKIVNGHIVVRNPLAYELPTHEVVIKSGRTTYRFTGSYDGQKSLPSKIFRLMEHDNLRPPIDKESESRYNRYKQSCIVRLPADKGGTFYVKAV